MGLVDLLWRALAVFRVGALLYVTVLVATRAGGYAHPVLGWLVLAGTAVWTGFASWGYAVPRRRTWPLLGADLVVAMAALAASYPVVGPEEMRSGAATLPMAWVAAPVIAWAVHAGRRAGAAAALAVGAVDLAVRGGGTVFSDAGVSYLNASVLLLLAGVIMGYVSRLAGQAEQRLQQAAQREAVIRERERLARGIHDSVLQVLALVQRRGTELGGEAAQLGRLAGDQEATLRALVAADGTLGSGGALGGGGTLGGGTGGGGMAPVPGGTGNRGVPGPRTADVLDLRAVLNRYASAGVTISAPAGPVPVPVPVATELAAAVGSALDNIRVHCGLYTPAWVLVEAEPDAVTVTVRDDGPGIPAGRLARAAADGRLGVAQSIQGRMRDLGGTATIVSAPGRGTEVELRLPLQA